MNHVLIADDIYENRYMLQALLEGNGYRVTATANGVEALAAAMRDAPDIIVSDVLMPKMDGFALCRTWMTEPALRSIPFVFYSGTYTNPEDEQFGLALGARRFLIKPLEPEAILQELTTVLGIRQRRRTVRARQRHCPTAPTSHFTMPHWHESWRTRLRSWRRQTAGWRKMRFTWPRQRQLQNVGVRCWRPYS